MALAERAELVARLSLDNKNFLQNARGSAGALKGMEGSLGRIAGHANRGLKNAATNLAKIGAIGAGFVALNVRSGIESLATLEDAVISVDGAIKQVGLTGRLTGQQVATWANEIENDVERAFDDKDIAQAATTLLRFGKVTDANLRPALVVMTDLAAKTGDVGSAGSLLAKALADPTKAAGRLARQGVILTKVEQDQIDALVKAGKVGEAQALVLQATERATKGAAAAMHGPYRDAMNILRDVTEDAQRALAEGFLPLLSRVADKLSTFLADPKNVQKIRDFGKGLADGFEKVLDVGSRIPWGLIGDSLKTAGAGAKIVFDALTGLPPWIQTAVLTGWGLNKLTGGALGSIIGEGIKVTFSQFAGRGASPANPLFVSQVGGVGGAGGKAGVGSAAAGIVGTAGALATAEGGVSALNDIQSGIAARVNRGTATILGGFPGMIGRAVEDAVGDPLGDLIRGTGQVRGSVDKAKAASDKITTRVENMKGAMVQATARSADRSVNAAERTRSGIVQAIRAIQRPIISVSVTGNTIRTVYRTGTTVTRNVSQGSMQAGLSG